MLGDDRAPEFLLDHFFELASHDLLEVQALPEHRVASPFLEEGCLDLRVSASHQHDDEVVVEKVLGPGWAAAMGGLWSWS